MTKKSTFLRAKPAGVLTSLALLCPSRTSPHPVWLCLVNLFWQSWFILTILKTVSQQLKHKDFCWFTTGWLSVVKDMKLKYICELHLVVMAVHSILSLLLALVHIQVKWHHRPIKGIFSRPWLWYLLCSARTCWIYELAIMSIPLLDFPKSSWLSKWADIAWHGTYNVAPCLHSLQMRNQSFLQGILAPSLAWPGLAWFRN